MKIGIDMKYIRHQGRGGNIGDELVQRNLLRLLGKTDPENQYYLYFNKDLNLERYHACFSPNISPISLNSSYQQRLLRNAYWMPKELKKNPVDLFHGSAALPFFSTGRMAITMWEFSPLIFPEYFTFYIRQTRNIMYRKSVAKASRIITGTRFMQGEIADYFNIPAERISVIPIGIEDRFMKKASPEQVQKVKDKHGISSNYLLSVGDIYPKKNILRLIQAVNLLKKENRLEEQLVVVGSNLWKSSEVSGTRLDHVTFTGFVPDEDIPVLYQGASAFIFPSLYEGFGIPVLEAMASGVPMALSNNTAFPEIAEDTAVYFDPFQVESMAEAIGNLMKDSDLKEKLVNRGKKRITQFSWDRIVSQYCELYKELAS